MLRTQDTPKKEEVNSLPTMPPAAPAPVEDTSIAANGHAPDKTLRVIENHPLAPLAGKYNDEPLWDDFLEAIQEYRQRMNEQDED